jgi:hypothetical protein
MSFRIACSSPSTSRGKVIRHFFIPERRPAKAISKGSGRCAHLKFRKREKPIRLTPTFEQFKAIIADVRAQRFNADAQDSADFLEFLGLAGFGTS